MKTFLHKKAQHVMKTMGATNPHAAPRIEKVVVNVGVGKQRANTNYVKAVAADLRTITGQAPHERKARQSVSGFSVRGGELTGYRVTLRHKKMSDFVERFIHVTLPRVRDFRGLSPKSLDGQGNLSVGLSDQMAFPEIRPEKTDILFGVEVTFVTTARNNAEGEVFFRALGFPLQTKES
jgi:large subunit ribosomal protein L5